MVLEQIDGDIFDSRFKNQHTCIVHQCNCVAIKPHGLSESIVSNFGQYTNVYSLRKPIVKRGNIATAATRSKPGEIHICHGSPNVAALFGQFLFGSSDPNARKYWQKTLNNDEELVKGYKNDTKNDRLVYFEKALDNLFNYFNQNLKIHTIVFPYRIGCGSAGGEWPKYRHQIEKFANKLTNYNVLIVKKN